MVNIKQVAARAGVSPSCVSKYLRDNNSVREYNRVRIAEAIAALHYVPSHVARSLRQGKSMTVKVIMPSITLPFFAEIFEYLHEPLLQAGYNLILQTIACDRKFVPQDFALTDGVIITFPNDDDVIGEIAGILRQMDKPLVVMTGHATGGRIPSIAADICDGMAKAAQYLKDHGLQRIAYVGGEEDSVTSSERFRGFSSVIPPAMRCGMYRRAFSMDWGYQAALKMLGAQQIPDGVLCENDGIAAGVIKCMTAHGHRVPDDIWVMGFDDIPLADMYNPSISSVSLPSKAMSQAAVETLLGIFNGEVHTDRQYQTTLVIRESTQVPTKRAAGPKGRAQ